MTAPSRRDTFAGGLWNVASMVVPLLSTVLLSAVIARRLGSLELGAQSFVSYVASLVSGLVITAATNCSTQLMASAYGARNGPR
ncbi:MAG: Membrane protein involved in the export of O-antigen and teichoic acid, partial [Frankiales bacterium]|nr:Membrane protein involved in the export of O-antigen and teichoic acid [Frankiales bacterium]